MKPFSWDKQLGLVLPLERAAGQSDETNHPSKNEVGLDVSHHIHVSPEGRGKYFFLDILFHRKSAENGLGAVSRAVLIDGYASEPLQSDPYRYRCARRALSQWISKERSTSNRMISLCIRLCYAVPEYPSF